MIQLEKYDEKYLKKSWRWLNDPQIKSLTDTADFTQEQQKKWFEGIDENPSYKIWGVSFNGIPIGVFGFKNINYLERRAEYWGYIGEKQYWGKGLGKFILSELLQIAYHELKLESIYLKVLEENNEAIKLYVNFDFQAVSNENGSIIMRKIF
ncbi:hypothetical protein FVB9288_00462 [Flavobacterium sp. CECT 9288]|uniref:GNAT family N-acetyltransferase n=1 Tax=Flavobacterium sp. CECT 9288 TaxID=2845819 RepID=UPI001E37EA35|nr:GNAT family N-acetyltransferase [Flavobacterium sp. CECT 9288]CAH0334854.1 hypothetical protein FVB9288_00462 [Flavobacterium sp. CECT 9288]